MSWTQPICHACWDIRNPNREPKRLLEPVRERCCVCGHFTRQGIYLRVNPASVPYPPDVVLTVDHVVPVSLGGSDDPSNLVAACRDCNAGKTSTSPDGPLIAEVSESALAWSEAMQQAAAERSELYEHDKQVAATFRTAWEQWGWTDFKGKRHQIPLPGNFDASIKNFLAAGLNFGDLEDLIKVAMSSKVATSRKGDTWKYFCGCCWKRIRQAQERAAEILAEEDDEDEEDLYSPEAIEQRHWRTAQRWRERYGSELAQCLCSYVADDSKFCGVTGCRQTVANLADAVLMGAEEVTSIVAPPMLQQSEEDQARERFDAHVNETGSATWDAVIDALMLILWNDDRAGDFLAESSAKAWHDAATRNNWDFLETLCEMRDYFAAGDRELVLPDCAEEYLSQVGSR